MICHRRGEAPGPTLLCIASLHGNEPAGTLALERVDAALRAAEVEIERGELVFLIGNLGALAAGKRYLDRDLNRGWSREAIARIRALGPRVSEDLEMLELDDKIEECQQTARGPLLFLDLHTTSAASPPFASVVDQSEARRLSRSLPVPTVLGMDSHLDGTLLEELDAHDFCGIIFEGGQHDEPEAVDHDEAAVWLLLQQLDFLPATPPAAVSRRIAWAHATLSAAAGSLPRLLEIEYRHAIDASCGFHMEPGFRSFEEVEPGQLLGRDRDGEVRSPFAARVLMPLYQAQGDDGFFLVREVD